MNKLFLLRQSCGEDIYSSLASPRGLWGKGQSCVTPTPLTAACTLLWPLGQNPKRYKEEKQTKQTNKKNKKVDGCFLPNGRHGALHFADDVKVFGRGRADDCVCFVRHLRLCVCRVLTEQRMNWFQCGHAPAVKVQWEKYLEIKQKQQNKQYLYPRMDPTDPSPSCDPCHDDWNTEREIC